MFSLPNAIFHSKDPTESNSRLKGRHNVAAIALTSIGRISSHNSYVAFLEDCCLELCTIYIVDLRPIPA